MAAILVGGVDEVDPRLHRSVQNFKGLSLWRLGAEVHGPKAEFTDLEGGPAQLAIFQFSGLSWP